MYDMVWGGLFGSICGGSLYGIVNGEHEISKDKMAVFSNDCLGILTIGIVWESCRRVRTHKYYKLDSPLAT